MSINKVGAIFLISIIGIAGIGVSYAGISDKIYISGYATTADVVFEVVDYSGTWIWKVWDFPSTTEPSYKGLLINQAYETAIYKGFYDENTKEDIETLFENWGCNYLFVSYAKSKPGTVHDTISYDVDMEFKNVFPCVDFQADFIMYYEGTIPIKITNIAINQISGYDFTPYLQWEAYKCSKDNGDWSIGDTSINVGSQIHSKNYTYFNIKLTIPQDNTLQGLTGAFSFIIDVVQWEDNNNPDADANGPYNGFFDDFITLDGSGSTDSDGNIILYEWDFEDDGVYDWSSTTSGVVKNRYPAGVYTARLKVTDDDYATDEDTATVTITANPCLQGFYKFDEAAGSVAYDSSGNTYNGNVNGASWTADAKNIYALDFDNTDYVDIGNNLNFEKTQAYSLEAWIKTTMSAPGAIIAKMNSANNFRGYDMILESGSIEAHLISNWGADDAIKVEANTIVNDGTWHHIIVTYDGSGTAAGLKIYIDGNPETLTVVKDSLTGSTVNDDDLRIGTRTTNIPFDGIIDEVKIYSCALSSDAVYNKYLDLK